MAALTNDLIQSKILDSNDLSLLEQLKVLPNETEVNDYKLLELNDIFMEHEEDAAKLEVALHKIAKEKLMNNKVEEAWKTLLAFND